MSGMDFIRDLFKEVVDMYKGPERTPSELSALSDRSRSLPGMKMIRDREGRVTFIPQEYNKD